MYRHSPVRNPRSKGIKIKHVLQVLLLVAVCFWLIFQVKRSHDKRKEFDASDNNVSLNTRTQISDEISKFGRKDLHPKVEETTKEIEIHQEQEDEDEHEENDDNKQDLHPKVEETTKEIEIHQEQEDEDEHEENDDNKHEEEEQDEGEKDDGGGGVDDEIDENEQEKSNVEIDREEVNIIDEDKEETEENDEKENEEKDGQSQTEKDVSLADHDEDGSAVHTNEAREENYNADDASSAVTHNGRTLGTGNEIKNGTLIEDVGQTAKNGTSSNITTTIQEKDYESIVTSLNATSSIDTHDNGPPSSTIVDSAEAQKATVLGEQAGNSSVTTSIDAQVVSNATIDEITQGSSNWTDISKDKSSDPSKTEAETEGGENLETNDVTDQVTEESLDPDEVDRSHLEEKEVRTDLDTLPEIETKGGNSEDTAAE